VSWLYKYTVDDEVLRVFLSSSKRQREELLRIFDHLAANSHMAGDSVQSDQTGRTCQVTRFGIWTVTWWAEHLVKELHVIDVERLR
jgi:hypothetical protein